MNTKRLLLMAAVLLGFGFTSCSGASAEDELSSRDDDSGRGINPGAPASGARAPDARNPGRSPGDTQTFAAFVIDLVQNKTTDATDAVEIPEGLEDTEDSNAFDVLFQ